MRGGVRLSTDVYRPKDVSGPLPTIFWRTPYNYNTLRGGLLRFVHEAVRHGYAPVLQNERGKFFSEGEWEILGRPRTDGVDALDWIAEQPWSNGKVGTVGCSSSAEWQLVLAAMDHPAHAAMVPVASGAGIGRVGPYWEQGNWYRGGGLCRLGGAVKPGVFDQRPVEARHDVLVYTSEPLAEPLDVTGGIEVVLYVSSDARDTDFTAKLPEHPSRLELTVVP